MDELWQRYRSFWTPVLIGLGVFLVGLIVVHVVSDDPEAANSKLVSTSRGSFDEDGAFEIVIENYPAPGERYEPSMTVLTGYRAPGAGSAD